MFTGDYFAAQNDDGNADAVGQSLWRRTMTRIERIKTDLNRFAIHCEEQG